MFGVGLEIAGTLEPFSIVRCMLPNGKIRNICLNHLYVITIYDIELTTYQSFNKSCKEFSNTFSYFCTPQVKCKRVFYELEHSKSILDL